MKRLAKTQGKSRSHSRKDDEASYGNRTVEKKGESDDRRIRRSPGEKGCFYQRRGAVKKKRDVPAKGAIISGQKATVKEVKRRERRRGTQAAIVPISKGEMESTDTGDRLGGANLKRNKKAATGDCEKR